MKDSLNLMQNKQLTPLSASYHPFTERLLKISWELRTKNPCSLNVHLIRHLWLRLFHLAGQYINQLRTTESVVVFIIPFKVNEWTSSSLAIISIIFLDLIIDLPEVFTAILIGIDCFSKAWQLVAFPMAMETMASMKALLPIRWYRHILSILMSAFHLYAILRLMSRWVLKPRNKKIPSITLCIQPRWLELFASLCHTHNLP